MAYLSLCSLPRRPGLVEGPAQLAARCLRRCQVPRLRLHIGLQLPYLRASRPR